MGENASGILTPYQKKTVRKEKVQLILTEPHINQGEEDERSEQKNSRDTS